MQSIIIIIDYYGGKWPEWFPLFLESCRRNPDINWLLHTDAPPFIHNIPNVTIRYISLEDYIDNVNQKLGINFKPADYYKLCDLRPAYGVIYDAEIEGFDFFGYGDLDVIYGNIRKFYTEKVLNNNVISTHTWCLSGHFALIRNVEWLRNAFRGIKNWEKVLEKQYNQRFDEDTFSKIFMYPGYLPYWLRKLYDRFNSSTTRFRRDLYFVEQYTTPMVPSGWHDGNTLHPTVWFWKDGYITNERDGDKDFIYLHFMNFKHARYMNPLYGKRAFWEELTELVHVKPEDYGIDLRIDKYGISPIESRPLT